jgi:hypothetical protein
LLPSYVIQGDVSFDWQQGDKSITRDVVTIVRRYRLLGFNAIRVPFSMTSLFKTAPRNFYGACQTTPDATLLAATTRPGISTPCEHLNKSPGSVRHIINATLQTVLQRCTAQAYMPGRQVPCVPTVLPTWRRLLRDLVPACSNTREGGI